MPNTRTESATIRAYHFVGETLRDGRPVPADGAWLEHTGPLALCQTGLHASRCPFDALRYAPGATLCRVDLGGDVIEDTDKLVASRRRIVARFDATALLWGQARKSALSVIHLWEAPSVVREYLETGDESTRGAARDAATRAAARAAAWVATRAASAAAAARGAARDAATRVAAWAATRDAAEAAAWGAARDAAEAAAWGAAAQGAARSTAWGAAWDAAWGTARDAARTRFREAVEAAFKEGPPPR